MNDTDFLSSDLLDPKEASAFLTRECRVPTAVSTLAKLRCLGGGPPFQYFGRRIRYRQSQLRDYAAARISPERISTSDDGPSSLIGAERPVGIWEFDRVLGELDKFFCEFLPGKLALTAGARDVLVERWGGFRPALLESARGVLQ